MTVLHVLPSGATLTDVGVPGPAAQPACIVCPGGGYSWLSPGEAEPVAEWLESIGVRGFVLRYRVAPNRHPASLEDAHAAIRLIRANAAAWGVQPAALGILGFSAGGHVAATASTHWDDRIERPDFAILIYPVITMRDPLAHAGSRFNLLGPNPNEALIDNLSNERQVNSDTPTSFIMHGVNDQTVPVGNALLYATALTESRVPYELHCIQDAPHGIGMGEPGTPTDWRPACTAWLQTTVDLGSEIVFRK